MKTLKQQIKIALSLMRDLVRQAEDSASWREGICKNNKTLNDERIIAFRRGQSASMEQACEIIQDALNKKF